MNEEKRKVLEMLAEGKITAKEAERLLEKLTGAPAEGRAREDDEPPRDKATDEAPPRQRRKVKYLRVLVDEAGGDKINVRVPLSLVRSGIKLAAILPQDAGESLHRQGFDLNELSKLANDELIDALAELQVDVDSEDGEVVRVFCE